MNPKEFIERIITLYRSARILKFPHKKLHRGRSHSIASTAEDLLAYYLANKIKADAIFIDQPVTIRHSKNQVYPDLVIGRKGELVGFIDLKTDIGWHRDLLYSLCKEKYKWLHNVRGKECKIRDGLEKTDTLYKVSEKASFNIVIISDQNIKLEKLKKQVIESKKLNPDVEVFILSKGKYLNTYGLSISDLMKRVIIDKKRFEKLISKFK